MNIPPLSLELRKDEDLASYMDATAEQADRNFRDLSRAVNANALDEEISHSTYIPALGVQEFFAISHKPRHIRSIWHGINTGVATFRVRIGGSASYPNRFITWDTAAGNLLSTTTTPAFDTSTGDTGLVYPGEWLLSIIVSAGSGPTGFAFTLRTG